MRSATTSYKSTFIRFFQLSEKEEFMLTDWCAVLFAADNLLQQRAELYEMAIITALRKCEKTGKQTEHVCFQLAAASFSIKKVANRPFESCSRGRRPMTPRSAPGYS